MQVVSDRILAAITTILVSVLALASTSGAENYTVRAGSFANISEPGAVVIVEICRQNAQEISAEITTVLKRNPLFKLGSRAETAQSHSRNAQLYEARMNRTKAMMTGRGARGPRVALTDYTRCELATFKKR